MEKTLKKALDQRRDFLIDKISDIYSSIGDEEKSENLMDMLFIYKDELNSIREIIKICEERGRY